MKRIVLLFTAKLLAINIAFSQYCTPAYNYGCSYGDQIENFSTTGGTTNITNNGSGCSPGAYQYFSQTVSQLQGGSINFTVQSAPSWAEGFRIWVDWNQDGDFFDPGEDVWNSGTYGTTPFTGTINVPLAALPGVTRMRVRCEYNAVPTDPCNSLSFGEAEDYDFNVISLSSCTPPPIAGTITSSANPVCSGTNFTLSLSGSSTGSGLSYQWLESTDGITYTPIPGATNINYSTSITSDTYYRCIVTCSAQDDTTAPYLVTLEPHYNCYCTSYATSVYDSKIDRVKISNIDHVSNPTTCETQTTISTPVGMLIQGQNYPILVRSGTCGGSYTRYGRVFIDYDQNGVYDVPSEVVFEFGPTTSGTPQEDFTGNVNIPNAALPGITGMRVVLRETSSAANVNPCGTYTWGETEDYIVNILPPPTDEAGINALISPALPACTLSDSIEIELSNEIATDSLTSATISYSINGGTPVNYNWTGNIPPGSSQNVGIGSATFSDGDVIKIWVSNPNGASDPLPSNDTIEVTLYEALQGTYTVYGTSPDYNSLTDAINDLELRGICDNVIFNVRTGNYTEQVLINDYISLGDYTVTIQSEGQNASDVEFSYSATGVSNNYVIGFEQTHDVIVQHLTLKNTSTTSYASVINFLGDNNDITVKNCQIYGDSLTTTTLFNKSVVLSNNGIDNNIQILNNEIVGGSYGVRLLGVNNSNIESGLKVEKNIIRKFYGGGVAAIYQNRPTIAANNIFTDSTNTYTNVLHIDVETSLNGAEIVGNNVNGRQGGSGIYLFNVDAQPNNRTLIANNFVYMGSTASPTNSHGISIQDCANASIVFNSIHTKAATTTAAGIRLYNGQSIGIELLNNNIVNSGAGYAVNSESLYYIDKSDYNNFYTTGSNFVRLGTDYSTLAALQSATGNDSNSVSVDPNFVGEDLHTCRVELDNAGIPIAGINIDFDGDIRNTQTPDIGADEFITPNNFTLGPDIIKCSNDSVLITAEQIGSATYYWSPYFQTTPSIYATNTGTYIVQVVSGCGLAVDSIDVSNYLTANAAFTSTISFFSAIFNNTSTNGVSYLWDFGDGNTSTDVNPTHVYADTGTYTVVLTVTDQCGNTSTATQTITIDVQFNSLEDEAIQQLNVYPNPTDGEVVVQFAFDGTKDIHIRVVDLTGRIVYNRNIGTFTGVFNSVLDLSAQPAGTYLMIIQVGEYTKVERLVVK